MNIDIADKVNETLDKIKDNECRIVTVDGAVWLNINFYGECIVCQVILRNTLIECIDFDGDRAAFIEKIDAAIDEAAKANEDWLRERTISFLDSASSKLIEDAVSVEDIEEGDY